MVRALCRWFGSLMLVAPVAALALPLAAQSGTIRYDQATRLDFDIPRDSPFFRDLPSSRVRPMVLTFSDSATLFVPVPDSGRRGGFGGGMALTMPAAPMAGRADIAVTAGRPMMGVRMMGRGGGAEAAAESYTRLDNGRITEVHEFLGRKFRIRDDRPTYPWKLTGEQAMFLDYPVMKATAQLDSTEIEAWFTPDIPVSGGPGAYGGLPGMILMLAVDTNRIVYTATAVDLTTPVTDLTEPDDGNEVTRAEYDKIVEDKMEELNQGRRGRRN